jgi:murein L,D-transpeptidase YcbB/YkuD
MSGAFSSVAATRTGLGRLLFCACAATLVAAPALASDGSNDWMRFPGMGGGGGAGAAASSQSYDRAFVREWEANPARGYPTLSLQNIEPMKAAIKRYTEIVKDGGWKPVPEMTLQPGANDPAVAVLRERLTLSGDLKEASSAAEHFDAALEKAVKRFQASNGLTPTGIVDKRTVAALNVTAQARLTQLKTNLTRLQSAARGAGKKYVVVNVPAAQIEAVEGDKVVSRHSGVVGKMDRQTPLLTSAIHEMNFNPVWHLPPTVIEKDLIPKGREMQKKNQSVLLRYNIEAFGSDGRKLDPTGVDWNGGASRNYVYKQQPGKDNPLGFLKINFHNNYSVYMHDTPSESLFGRNFRAASSGCVRVQGIEQLAAWLLTDNGWTAERIEKAKETGERQDVRLKKPVPLYFVYITAWATEDGVVQFRRDLYQKDGVGPTAAAY